MEKLERRILDTLPALVYLLASDYTIPYANQHFRERFGDPGKGPCYRIINGRDTPCENCTLSNVMDTWNVHMREMICSDELTYQVVGTPFKDKDGTPLVLGMGCDITTRKANERVLQKSHDELERNILRRSEELSRINAHLQREIEMHKRTEAMMRQQQEIIAALARLKKILLKPTSLEDIPELVLNEAKVLTDSDLGYVGHVDSRTNSFVSLVTKVSGSICREEASRCFNGLWEWVLHRRESLLSNDLSNEPRLAGIDADHRIFRRLLCVPAFFDGNPVGMIALVNADRDYTSRDLEVAERLADIYALSLQRKLVEENMRWTNQHLNALIQASPLSIMVVNRSGEVTIWNQTAYRTFGWSHKEMFDQSFPVFPGDMVHGFKALHQRIMNKKVVADSIELKAMTKTGALLDVAISSAPVLSVVTKDKVCCAIFIMEDITSDKEMKNSLRDKERQLRHLSTNLLSNLEKERTRIAFELHDRIGQSLTAIKYCMESALVQEEPQGRKSLQSGVALVQSSIDEVRKIAMDLRPSILDDLGLLATINWFCREYRKIYAHLRITKRILVKKNQVPETLKIVIYRVMQEAFNNVVRHSRASKVLLVLKSSKNVLELKVQDNGQGFDPEINKIQDHHARGLGLASMREQTEISGGRFMIITAPGKGTTLLASWPL